MEPRSLLLLFPSPLNKLVLSYSAEVKRKAIHLPALAMPIGLLIAGRPTALWVLVPLSVFALTADIARQRIEPVHRRALEFFRPLMRPEELPPFGGPLVLNGATWMILCATLCTVLYEVPIAAAALIMLILGDSAAALIGRRYGKHALPRSEKSWEGSIAFILVAAIASLPLTLAGLMVSIGHFPLSLLQIGVGALVATMAEALPLPLNDNIRVPILAGLAMTFV